ncbi:Rhs family protein [Minicystis rosea]|nr:Rhs family protein [Minicystis rosea]
MKPLTSRERSSTTSGTADERRRWRTLIPLFIFLVCLLGSNETVPSDSEPSGGSESTGTDQVGLVCPSYDPSHSPFPTALPTEKPEPAGRISGSFAVSQAGEATYAIPLIVPPGRAGMEPSLAVAYSSNTGQGIVGVGFGLRGFSAIFRCGSNLAQDGVIRGVKYDTSDHFCLDGVRLVQAAVQPGMVEYRTFPDTFKKIIAHYPGNRDWGWTKGPQYFEVFTKAGRILRYGSTEDSRALARDHVVASWWIGREEDRRGNSIDYRYHNDLDPTEGYTVEHYPDEIRYTGHETTPGARVVHFDYRESNLHRTFYSAGMELHHSKLLSSARMFGPDGTEVRSYLFNYTAFAGTFRPLLEQVWECAWGACKPPTKFTWSSHDQGALTRKVTRAEAPPDPTSELGFYSQKSHWLLTDVTGDGLDDIVVSERLPHHANDDSTTWFDSWTLSSNIGEDPIFSSSQKVSYIELASYPSLGPNDKADALPWWGVPFDYDMDGRKDFLLDTANAVVPTWQVLHAKPSGGFEVLDTGIARAFPDVWGPGNWFGALLADVNGDGAADLIECDNPWLDAPDFNEPDSVQHQQDAYRWTVRFWTPAGFEATTHPILPLDGRSCSLATFGGNSLIKIADLNADGKLDLIVPERGFWVGEPGLPACGDHCTYQMLSYVSGDTWSISETNLPLQPSSGLGTIVFPDVNGDGLPDAVQMGFDDDHPRTFMNTGRGFAAPVQSLSVPPLPQGERLDWFGHLAQLIDYNGDGAVDILMPMWFHCANPQDDAACWVVLQANYKDTGTFHIVDTHIPFAPDLTYFDQAVTNHGPYRAIQVSDVDGDGRHDIVVPENGTFSVYKNDGPQDLLLAVTDGMNPLDSTDAGFEPTVTIQYGSLVDLARTQNIPDTWLQYENMTYLPRFDAGNDCAFPRSCVVGARRVVSKYTFNNGANVPRTFFVRYRDGRLDHLGHGFLGFGARIVIDGNTSAGSAEFYDNITYDATFATYPYAGHLVRSWAWTPGMVDQVEVTYTNTRFQMVASNDAPTYFTMGAIHRVRREEGKFTPSNGLTYFQYVQAAESNPTTVLSDSWRIVSNVDQYGNVLGVIDTTDDVDLTNVTYRTYSNDPNTWLIGRIDSERACSTALGETQCRTTQVLNRNQYGEVVKLEMGDPSDAQTKLTLGYARDAYGNVTHTVANDAYGHLRKTCVSYDEEHIFPYASRNAAGHTTYTRFDRGLGVVTAVADLNELVTLRGYDGFGRMIRQIRPDGGVTSVKLKRPKDGGPQGNWYNVKVDVTTSTSDAEQITTFDSLGRIVHTQTRGPGVSAMDAQAYNAPGSVWYIEQETEYDSFGRVARTSLPWMTGDPSSSRRYYQFTYDGANRVIEKSTPWNSIIGYAYGDNVTTVTDSAGATSTQVDALGRIVLVTDKRGKTTSFTYGPFSGRRDVSNINETTSTERDAYGRVRKSNDPDRHVTTMDYDGYGDVTHTVDALSRSYTYEYDAVGRLVERLDPDGLTTWEYDTAANGMGRIARVVSSAGHAKDYDYDALSRPYRVALTIDGETFAATLGYDSESRLKTIAYPQAPGVAPFVLRHEYDKMGNLVGVHDNAGGTRFWQLDYVDNAGRPTLEWFGNGTFTFHEYLQDTGTIKNIVTGLGPASFQDLRYTYDDRLNVKSRTDALQNIDGYLMAESFQYDALDRLTCAGFVKVPPPIVGPPEPPAPNGCDLSVQYAPNGNVEFKSDVGAYKYEAAHPHAVRTAGAANFEYDAVGNQVRRPGVEIKYTPFDLPSVAMRTDDGTEIRYDYDGDQQRIRKTGPKDRETIYFGNLYERVTDTDGTVKHRYYVAAGSATIVITRAEGKADEYAYIHPDALGSPDIVTNKAGAVVEQHSYDAFGARRNPKWGQLPSLPFDKGVNVTFTGHEPDDELGLVNMRGRIYDPKVARFLQTDPIVSRPGFSQSWNAYSYVLNNPLKWIDPSGFDADGPVLQNTYDPKAGIQNVVLGDAQLNADAAILQAIHDEIQGRTNACFPTEAPSASNPEPNPTQDDFSSVDEAPVGMPAARAYDYRRGDGFAPNDPRWGIPNPSYDTGQEDTDVVEERRKWGAVAMQVALYPHDHVQVDHTDEAVWFADIALQVGMMLIPEGRAEEALVAVEELGCGPTGCFGGSSCFVAGTPVLTPDGTRPIETLKPGDIVVSHAPDVPFGTWRVAAAACVEESLLEGADRSFNGFSRAPGLDDVVWVLADGVMAMGHAKLADVYAGSRVAFEGVVFEIRKNNEQTEIRESGETLQRVRQAIRRGAERLVELTVRTELNEHRLVGTPEHPFYLPALHRFVPMGGLKPGMMLLSDGGRAVEVVGLERRTESSEVFNVEVERTHTYYTCDWSAAACELVHNADCFELPKIVRSGGGVEGSFREHGYTYRIDTNKVAPGEGGFHIHVYRKGEEVAKLSGKGGYVKMHRGTELAKPSELPRSVRNDINRLVKHVKELLE